MSTYTELHSFKRHAVRTSVRYWIYAYREATFGNYGNVDRALTMVAAHLSNMGHAKLGMHIPAYELALQQRFNRYTEGRRVSWGERPGTVAYRRRIGPICTISVVLDDRRDDPSYTGTILPMRLVKLA